MSRPVMPSKHDDKLSVSLEMEVAFFDVDSYQIVWHGNYPKYFEIARCKLLEKIDLPYRKMEEANYFFPIIDINIKYIKPLIFGQKFTIRATITEWKNKLTIHYIIQDPITGEQLTKGSTSQVAVLMPEHITQFTTPSALLDKINKALDS